MTDPFDISETAGLPVNYDPLELTPATEPVSTMEGGVPNRDTVTLYQIDGYNFTYAQYQAYLAQQEQIYNDMLAEYEAAVEEATLNALTEAEAFIGSIEAPVSHEIDDYLSVADVTGSSQGNIASANPGRSFSHEISSASDDMSFDPSLNSHSPRYYDISSIITDTMGHDIAIDNSSALKPESPSVLPMNEDGVDLLKDYGFFSGGITVGLEGGFSFADAEPGQDDFHEKWSNWPRKAQTRAALVRSNLYEPEEL